MDQQPLGTRLLQVAGLMLKLGVIGFGGPAAHIAALEDEVVTRRGWLSRQRFLDLVGATNLIPGPNSTEVTMHIGLLRAGWPGLLLGGACFILPAVTITAALAWVYVQLGSLPQVEPVLAGIKPAVIAIILAAGWKLCRKAVKNWLLGVVAAASMVLALSFVGHEIKVLLAVSLVGLLVVRWREAAKSGAAASIALPLLATVPGTGGAPAAAASLWQLGLFFLKVGAVLYGSGYVLFAYLEGGLVHDYGWLTQEQLLDAVAIGQFTPGPILSTATFIGFVVMCPTPDGPVGLGLQGAALASAAIFLPSFVFVALLGPIVPRLRENPWAAAFLDAVNAASIGLMAAVTLRLAMDVFLVFGESGRLANVNWASVLIFAAACAAVFRWKISAAWLVLGGALTGWGLWAAGVG